MEAHSSTNCSEDEIDGLIVEIVSWSCVKQPAFTATVMDVTIYLCMAIIAVNSFVLFQGVAILMTVSQRKCCGHKKIGFHCCCTKKDNCMSTTKERLHRRELLLMKEHGDATERHRAIERKSHERAVAFLKALTPTKMGQSPKKSLKTI